ncbi:aminopeptidase [Alkalibacter rhizosphaerae]|uniref:Aminopeptidase n=1 Tax=Alkalibacter rhizosphaerae TaxID=2815577 RepID=A0A974XH46_9FIRM|nr:aminopeptidase [Alkalibacter rhizosphaerae]QSX08625.1 aminopeptidase [Alkalibacter rhizosphaerae]
MKNLHELMKKYAALMVEKGIHLEKDQILVITASVENVEFVRMVAETAYLQGASNVHVNWNDGPLTKLKYQYAPMEVFQDFPLWYAQGMESFGEKGAAFLSIISQDPELLKEADPKKISAYNKAASTALKGFRRYTMNSINSWCVVAIPGAEWAKSLFPDMSEKDAVNALWEAILKANRVDTPDPFHAWDEHVRNLDEKVRYLNERHFDKLLYRSSKGTDLEVVLPRGHVWAGGSEKNGKKRMFIANMPTEEVFTLPLKTGINGILFGTMPLYYSGNKIDGFSFVFKDGRIVEFQADTGMDVLTDLLNTDEGSRYLGEVALVPHDSPISNTGMIFKNTLFDENASCHFALGKAYPTSLKDGGKLSEEELKDRGVNDSLVHVDFMVGGPDLEIVGVDEKGEETQLFMNGNWSI